MLTASVRGRRKARDWFAIVEALQKDQDMAFQKTPRMWEEMIAGAYERAGFHEVILTPRSGTEAGRAALGSALLLTRVSA